MVTLAARRADVADLNTRARTLMAADGRLSGPVLHIALDDDPSVPAGDSGSTRSFAVGDHVIARANHYPAGILNGQTGRVVAVHPDRSSLVVRAAAGEIRCLLPHGRAVQGHMTCSSNTGINMQSPRGEHGGRVRDSRLGLPGHHRSLALHYFPFYARMVVTSDGVWVHNLFRQAWIPWRQLTEVTTNDRVVLHTEDWAIRVTAVQRANAAAMTGSRSRVDRVREHLLATQAELAETVPVSTGDKAKANDGGGVGGEARRGPVPVPWALVAVTIAWLAAFTATMH